MVLFHDGFGISLGKVRLDRLKELLNGHVESTNVHHVEECVAKDLFRQWSELLMGVLWTSCLGTWVEWLTPIWEVNCFYDTWGCSGKCAIIIKVLLSDGWVVYCAVWSAADY